MAAIPFTSPKSLLVKLADVFQGRTTEAEAPQEQETTVRNISTAPSSTSEKPNGLKSKMNVSLDDLKTISTALLHYKRNLARMGEMQRAETVGTIDQKFFDLIQVMEAQAADSSQEDVPSAA